MKKLSYIDYYWKTRGAAGLFYRIMMHLGKALKIGFGDNGGNEGFKVDIVMPTTTKDFELLELAVDSLKNIRHSIGNIYIVSDDDPGIANFCKARGIIFIDEKSVLGYDRQSTPHSWNGTDRSGWIFQQLLKLAGPNFVAADDYIVLDSDTVIINKMSFHTKSGKYILYESEEWHKPYFKAFERLLGFKASSHYSFVSHMMIFNNAIMREMWRRIEKVHGMTWDKAFFKVIDRNEKSPIADYETYGNWLSSSHPELVEKRFLYNVGLGRHCLEPLDALSRIYSHRYNTLSFHSYIKRQQT
jgi:hypothetical protein